MKTRDELEPIIRSSKLTQELPQRGRALAPESVASSRVTEHTVLNIPKVPSSTGSGVPVSELSSAMATKTMPRDKQSAADRAFQKTTEIPQYNQRGNCSTPAQTPGQTPAQTPAQAQGQREASPWPSGDWDVPASDPRTPKTGLEAQRRALHLDELERARAWAAMTIFLPASCLVLLPFLDAPPGRRLVYALALLYMIAVSIFVWARTSDPKDYTPGVFRLFGYSAASVSFVIVYFLGVFSPTPLVVTLGLSFYGTGRDKRHALGICVYAIMGYFVLLLLTALGVIEDVGMVSASGSSLPALLTFVVLCPLVLIATMLMARVTRRSTDEAMARYHQAAAQAKEHEAQLLEAHRELEHALKLGAGQSGSFTGVLAGRFKLGPVIGQGGMGVVYAAIDPNTGERAAVKVLKISEDEDPTDYKRFLREGTIARSLNLQNVVSVFDCGQLENFDVPYIAMEHLKGTELARMLRRRSRMPAREVAELASHLAHGLDGAHAVGIVHRDLKPRNIFLCDASNAWKILDFGVCKTTNSKGTLTGINQLIGTPSYMSPEQARGISVDHRSDIFALGSVLYRSITGRPPFNGQEIASVVFEIVFRHPERPSHVVKGLNSDIDRVLAIALSKEREERFNSAGEFAAAFQAAVDGELNQALRERGEAAMASGIQAAKNTLRRHA